MGALQTRRRSFGLGQGRQLPRVGLARGRRVEALHVWQQVGVADQRSKLLGRIRSQRRPEPHQDALSQPGKAGRLYSAQLSVCPSVRLPAWQLVMTLFGCCVNGAQSPLPSLLLSLPTVTLTLTRTQRRQRKLKAHFKIFHT